MFDSPLDNLVPISKLQILTYIVCGLALIGAIFFAGWTVNGWRLNATHAEQVADMTAQIAMWQGKVHEQNAATDLLHERKAAADDRRNLARDMSKSVLEGIDAKAAKAAASTATDCEGVLREAHGDAR